MASEFFTGGCGCGGTEGGDDDRAVLGGGLYNDFSFNKGFRSVSNVAAGVVVVCVVVLVIVIFFSMWGVGNGN
jgi:hypothetical protein